MHRPADNCKVIISFASIQNVAMKLVSRGAFEAHFHSQQRYQWRHEHCNVIVQVIFLVGKK